LLDRACGRFPLAALVRQYDTLGLIESSRQLVDRVRRDRYFSDICGRHTKQAGVDPVGKAGRGIGLGLHRVGSLSAWDADIAPTGLAFNRFPENVIGEHRLLRVAQCDALASALQATYFLVERVDNAILCVILYDIGANLVFL